MLHGLGEHAARHSEHLQLIADRGIFCQSFDWPGHGYSEGPRGHIDSQTTIDTLIEDQLGQLRERIGPNKPIGLFGHSMGGFLALCHLTRFPSCADFAWIGSTLVDPAGNAPAWKRRLARVLDRFTPGLRLGSGIRSEDCRQGPSKRRDPLMHKKISVRLGKLLMDAAPRLAAEAKNVNPTLRLLMTHGSADRVCPAEQSRALFDSLPIEHKTYVLFDGVLHEPFHGEDRAILHETLTQWIDDELLPAWDSPI